MDSYVQAVLLTRIIISAKQKYKNINMRIPMGLIKYIPEDNKTKCKKVKLQWREDMNAEKTT